MVRVIVFAIVAALAVAVAVFLMRLHTGEEPVRRDFGSGFQPTMRTGDAAVRARVAGVGSVKSLRPVEVERR